MPSRRSFLAIALGGVAVAGGWRFFRSREQDAIVLVLRKKLNYLHLDENGMRAFAADLASRKIVSSTRLRLIGALGPIYQRFAFGHQNAVEAGIQHGEERIVTNFLLSSEFFINGADETRLVRYLGFYDAVRACSNPFARFERNITVTS